MKILHTSDWHLGKRLGIFSRQSEQEEVMNELCHIAESENIDLVIVAGDIFDTYNPPIEATELYYRTVKTLSKNGTRPVIVIAGNHDSPDRIESSDPLAKELGIIQAGFPKTKISPYETDGFSIAQSTEGGFSIKLESGERINILHTAFSNEQRLSSQASKTISEEVQELWQSVLSDLPTECPTVLITHALMSKHSDDKIEEPEGEKPIEHISEHLSSAIIPQQINYTALGHLHRYQKIADLPSPVVYSGSPLAYSFSESNQPKFVSIFDTQSNSTEKHQIQSGKKLIRKRTKSITEAVEWAKDNNNCWAELHIETDSYLTPEQLSDLKNSHDGIVAIVPVRTNADENNAATQIDLTKSRIDLFKDYFESKKGVAPSDDILALFNEIVSAQ